MDTTTSHPGEALLKTEVTRRGTLTAAAWAAPVIAVAAATPAAVASGVIDPTTDLVVGATGGSEGFYSTGGNANLSQDSPNNTQNFRRGFWVENTGSATFTGTLRIAFKFPRKWNEAITERDVDAFNNWTTRDLGGSGGASIGGATGWTVSEGTWVQNQAPSNNNVWTAVWFRMDDAHFDLTDVVLPPGGVIWFALNAGIPSAWINATGNTDEGTYIWVNASQNQVTAPGPGVFNGRIYWKSDLSIAATTTGAGTSASGRRRSAPGATRSGTSTVAARTTTSVPSADSTRRTASVESSASRTAAGPRAVNEGSHHMCGGTPRSFVARDNHVARSSREGSGVHR